MSLPLNVIMGSKRFVKFVSCFLYKFTFCTNAFFSVSKDQCICEEGIVELVTLFTNCICKSCLKKINKCYFFLVNCLSKAVLPFLREACKKRLS